MKAYLKRLAHHPGIGMASLLTCMGALAGSCNKSFESPLTGALFGTKLLFVRQ